MARSVFTPAYSAFVNGLVEARRASGITQVELARRLAKPQSFVSKIERGERRLDIIEFCAIARAMGFEPDSLLAAILRGLPGKLSI
jgi:transcriptional regulator with XRE-family HTH domain